LILALALVVVATALIGSLMSLYARSFSTKAEDVKRKQLARSVLTMMADDIRAVVLQSDFDTSAFELLFGAEAMDLENFQLTGDEEASLGLGTEANAEPETGAAALGMNANSDMSMLPNSALPTGIYGNQYQLMVDVSRAARIDELAAMQLNLEQAPLGTLRDIPGDMKRVTYFVQAASPMGVQDTLAQIESRLVATSESTGMKSGLVRRQLDRAVTSFAEASGLASQLSATGDLVSPEVVSLEFSYFDGVQWTYQWDSSQLGLPWLINISLAMQSASGEQKAGVPTGMSISTMDRQQKEQYGIEVYELTVAIPGAQMMPKPSTMGSSTDSSTTGVGSAASSASGGRTQGL